MTAPPSGARNTDETAKRRLALGLDIAATAGLIAGTAALVAIADTRTFGVSRIYIAAVVVAAPIVGLAYLAARRASAGPVAPPPMSPPPAAGDPRRGLAICLAELLAWFGVLNVVLLPGNLMLTANRWLDRSAPVEQAFVVDHKKYLHKDKRAYFHMTRAGASAKESVPVSTALYDRIVLNRTKVVLTMHEGALGFPWTRHAELRWSELAPSR